jgi:hypothetical protein
MTQFPHDQFAKDLFELLLSPFGIVEIDRTITSEVRAIDIYFTPRNLPTDFPSLGLLLKCAQTGAAFEAFRNPVPDEEIPLMRLLHSPLIVPIAAISSNYSRH